MVRPLSHTVPRRRQAPRGSTRRPPRRRAFINPEGLFAFGVFVVVAALLLPSLDRKGWRWAAVPFSVVSLALGALASAEVAQLNGRAAAVVFALFVLAVTAFGAYRLAF